jgi:hypothetical protein
LLLCFLSKWQASIVAQVRKRHFTNRIWINRSEFSALTVSGITVFGTSDYIYPSFSFTPCSNPIWSHNEIYRSR